MKKYLWIGLIGSVFSLAGDLLLSWLVYPESSDYYIAMIASCADLSYLRLGLSALCGGIGIPLQYYGFKAVAEIIGQSENKNALRCQNILRLGATPTALFGGSVHILCVALMLIVRIECNNGFSPLEAATLLDAFPQLVIPLAIWAVLPISVICMVPYMIAMIAMFWAFFKKDTNLPRWMCLLNPLVFVVVVNIVTEFAPNTSLFNGLRMANKPFGAIATFICCLFFLKEKKIEV